MLPRFDPETREWLHATLADQYPHLLPFVAAASAQLVRAEEGASLHTATERVVSLLRDEPSASRDRVDVLLSDPPLLAALFQNVDLLYEHAYEDADEVSAWIMQALERAERHA